MEPTPVHSVSATDLGKGSQPAHSIFKRIERQFAANWTGILGAVIMVMGVSFLGIYAALALTALFRFVMIAGIAAGLFGAYLFMRSRTPWVNLAAWLRSSAGALLLFGCLGSGGIPGLTWIDNPYVALALLAAGIAANLACGYAGRTQLFASLHVCISLISLGIAPQSQVTLGIAAVIVILSVLLTFRARWEYHLLITITAWFAYHLFWFYSSDFGDPVLIPPHLRIAGIASVCAIGILAAFVHYRRLYATGDFEPLPFVTHLANWCFLAVGALHYSTGSKWNTIVLAAASASAFVLAHRARSLGIPWLRTTDTLIALSIAMFAAFTLGRWNVDPLPIAGIVYLELLVFHVIIARQDSGVLRSIAAVFRHMACAAFIITALTAMDQNGPYEVVRNAVVMCAAVLLEILFHIYGSRTNRHRFDTLSAYSSRDPKGTVSIGGIVIAMMILVTHAYLFSYRWTGFAIGSLVVGLILIRQISQSAGLGVGVLILLPAQYVFTGSFVNQHPELSTLEILMHSVPFAAMSISSIFLSYVERWNRHLAWPGLYLFTLHIVSLSATVFKPVSPYILGIVVLIVSSLYLELARLSRENRFYLSVRGSIDRFLLQLGYLLIGIFVIVHVTIHLQSEEYLGFVHVRLLIELFAIAVLLFWALAKRPSDEPTYKSWIYLHPLLWELIVAFIVLAIALEVPVIWHPAAWIILAMLLVLVGRRWAFLSRLQFHATLFHWSSAFQIAFIAGTYAVPSAKWMDQGWIAGCVAIALQFAHVVLFHRTASLGSIAMPPALSRFNSIVNRIDRRKNLWIYYPFFISIALFFFWSFDRSILTLLWVLESFAVFVVSLIVKENHFRIVSMIGLGACLVRLIAFDLARSGTLMRAVVFLCVGGIMIFMNVLYNKYKDRF